MLYYFSSTGNSKYVAERIAEVFSEQICAMEKLPKGMCCVAQKVYFVNPNRKIVKGFVNIKKSCNFTQKRRRHERVKRSVAKTVG